MLLEEFVWKIVSWATIFINFLIFYFSIKFKEIKMNWWTLVVGTFGLIGVVSQIPIDIGS